MLLVMLSLMNRLVRQPGQREDKAGSRSGLKVAWQTLEAEDYLTMGSFQWNEVCELISIPEPKEKRERLL